MESLKKNYAGIVDKIREMGYTSEQDEMNFRETPDRCSRALLDFIKPLNSIKEELEGILKKDFPMIGDPGIVCTDCVTIGMCPHHFLPVFHQIYLGYLPISNDKIIGTSKLIRLAKVLSKRPILQEQLAIDITATLYNGRYYDIPNINEYTIKSDKEYDEYDEALNRYNNSETGFPYFESRGSFCIMGSVHSCICSRGIESFSLIRESSMRGLFLSNEEVRSEAYEQIRAYPSISFIFK